MQTNAKTVWDCRQAQAEIALKAGGDLDDPVASQLLDSHLGDCTNCRQYLAGMEAALDILQSSAVQTLSGERTPSLWPRIARRLPPKSVRAAYTQFNVWVPTAAMATACAAMILVTLVQIERVVPFSPRFTPHLRTVLHSEAPDRFLHDSEFAQRRGSTVLGSPQHATLPVNYPAETNARWVEW